MRKAYLFIAICCIGTLCSTYGARSQSTATNKSTVHGTVESFAGGPVVLSDAWYTVANPGRAHGTFQINGNGVKVQNVSGQAIRVLYLGFAWKGGFTMRVAVAIDGLSPGETREYSGKDMRAELLSDPANMTLNVMPTGVAFEDGSHWAAPRTQSGSLVTRLVQFISYLRVRDCKVADGTYEVSIDNVDPKIVAYRLGAIKDTPDSFQVSLGRWVNLTEVERDQKGSFVDSGQSLKSPSKDVSATASRDTTGSLESGLAIFVAALKFVDGRVWYQDTRRQELLWNN